MIATAGENSLAAVDLLSFELWKTIELGASPTAVISATEGNRNYVLTPATGSVHLLDGELRGRATRRLADHVSQIRLTPDGKGLLAIANSDRGQLVEVDAQKLAVSRRFAIEAEPTALDVSTNGYAAVATGKAGTVELVHLPSGRRLRTQMTGDVGAVRFRSDGQMLLVANRQDRTLTALTVPALQVIAELPLAMVPENLCFDSYGGQLFVTGAEMDGVAIVFPYQTLEVDQTVLAGRTPGVMACSDAPPYLFVASRDASDVSVLSVETRMTVGVVGVGQKPGFVAITPDSQYALVLNEASGDVAVIHIPGIQGHKLRPGVVQSTRIGPLFAMIPVGSRPVSAAIVTSRA